MPPDLSLWLTLISSNYLCLEHIFMMVPKVFEPLKFDCSIKRLRNQAVSEQIPPEQLTKLIVVFHSKGMFWHFFFMIKITLFIYCFVYNYNDWSMCPNILGITVSSILFLPLYASGQDTHWKLMSLYVDNQ